jgi:predicted flap endonuclease-1-like 5' DNA nuclease
MIGIEFRGGEQLCTAWAAMIVAYMSLPAKAEASQRRTWVSSTALKGIGARNEKRLHRLGKPHHRQYLSSAEFAAFEGD